jgi:hypothetical protein
VTEFGIIKQASEEWKLPTGMADAEAEPKVLWKPWPGFQTKALECGANEALFGGAAGPGKTDVLIACGGRYAQHPAARILFLRTSYTDLQDVRDRMALIYPAMGATWQSESKRWVWPSGATIEMGYGETVAEVSRYVGREYTAVLFDELGLVADEAVWTWLFTRIRSTDPTVPLRMRASANPGGPGHGWLKARFVNATNRGTEIHATQLPAPDGTATVWTRAYVPGTAKDNPSLPASYWAALNTLPPSLRAALAEGDWDAGLGLFYPELAGADGDRLLVPPVAPEHIPDWWDFWGGYDWGYRHPAVFVACARDGEGVVHVMDTLYLHKLGDQEQVAEIRGLATDRPPMQQVMQRVYAGHDAFFKRQAHSATPETVQDVFDKHHVHLSKASLDRGAGSRALRRLIGTRKIVLWDTPGNRRLLSELRSLIPDVTRAETPRKVDANPDTGLGGDDGPDALRYAIATPEFLVNTPATASPSPEADDPTPPHLVPEAEAFGHPTDPYPEGYV